MTDAERIGQVDKGNLTPEEQEALMKALRKQEEAGGSGSTFGRGVIRGLADVAINRSDDCEQKQVD